MKTAKLFAVLGALAALAFSPAQALAQRGREPAAPKIDGAALAAGKKAAPAIVQAMGLNCQISEARLIGQNTQTKTSFYEVACGPGAMGYILQAVAGGANTGFTCLEANAPPMACALKDNADPKAALVPMLTAAKLNCTPTAVRGIGQAPGATYLEVQCANGMGYVVTADSAPLDTSKPIKPPQNCLMYDDAQTNIKCTLADAATRLAIVDTYAKTGAAACVVKNRRFVGAMQNGSTYFEASCQDGKGFVFRTNSGGSLEETIDCLKAATMLPGGCTLTDTRQALTEQNALYTRLAKSAGGACDVERYAVFPAKPGEEAVELACKDGAGVVGIFKASGGGSQVIDCGRAPAIGFACSMTTKINYTPVTADLKKVKPEANTCAVSNTRVVGKSAAGNVMIEVACADGFKGYLIEYKTEPTLAPIAATNCGLAAGGLCKLPGNS